MFLVKFYRNGNLEKVKRISDDEVIKRFARVAAFNHAGLDYKLERHQDEFFNGLSWYELTFSTSNGNTIKHNYLPVI